METPIPKPTELARLLAIQNRVAHKYEYLKFYSLGKEASCSTQAKEDAPLVAINPIEVIQFS